LRIIILHPFLGILYRPPGKSNCSPLQIFINDHDVPGAKPVEGNWLA
jgi:hypothetical protein